jgi:hypothetical protein
MMPPDSPKPRLCSQSYLWIVTERTVGHVPGWPTPRRRGHPSEPGHGHVQVGVSDREATVWAPHQGSVSTNSSSPHTHISLVPASDPPLTTTVNMRPHSVHHTSPLSNGLPEVMFT